MRRDVINELRDWLARWLDSITPPGRKATEYGGFVQAIADWLRPRQKYAPARPGPPSPDTVEHLVIVVDLGEGGHPPQRQHTGDEPVRAAGRHKSTLPRVVPRPA